MMNMIIIFIIILDGVLHRIKNEEREFGHERTQMHTFVIACQLYIVRKCMRNVSYMKK